MEAAFGAFEVLLISRDWGRYGDLGETIDYKGTERRRAGGDLCVVGHAIYTRVCGGCVMTP